MVTVTERTVRDLVTKIKKSANDMEIHLRRFHEVEGWAVLGYDSFLAWWDADMGSVSVGQALRNWAVYELVESNRQPGKKKIPAGTYAQVADLMGVSVASISSTLGRARYRMRETSRTDADMTTLTVLVPERWRRNIITTASSRNVNMADVVRPAIVKGMKQIYGVDVNESIAPKVGATSRRRSG